VCQYPGMPPPATAGVADIGDDGDDGDEADDDGAAASPGTNRATMPAEMVGLPAVVVATADGAATPSATVCGRVFGHTPTG